jgi:hypothetical protein
VAFSGVQPSVDVYAMPRCEGTQLSAPTQEEFNRFDSICLADSAIAMNNSPADIKRVVLNLVQPPKHDSKRGILEVFSNLSFPNFLITILAIHLMHSEYAFELPAK